MPDAKGVEGSQPRPSLLRAAAAKRPLRKPGEPGAPPLGHGPTSLAAPPGAHAPSAPAPAQPVERPARPTGGGCRLDDLYRMPMPKLFSLAEQEGITEHTGMNSAQMIVRIVRRLIEQGGYARTRGTPV